MDPDFPELTVPHLISRYELKRDLDLSKIQLQFLVSGPQGWNLLQKEVKKSQERSAIFVIIFLETAN